MVFAKTQSAGLRPKVKATNTDSGTTDQFEFRSTRRKKRSNVSHRRFAEETAVLAIELRGAFKDFEAQHATQE
jgi:hypothetical protein